MKIKVEDRHIERGVRECRSGCPIALAAREAISGYAIEIGKFSLCLWNQSFRHQSFRSVSLPENATAFVSRFDAGMPVVPFEFEIKL